MKKKFGILNSTIFMVLFCYTDSFSLPLTRTFYTLPEEHIDLSLKSSFVDSGILKRKDNFEINMGLGGDTSVGFDFSLINENAFPGGGGVMGDILFNIWHFTGDYSGGFIKTGFSLMARIPAGPDAYTNEKHRDLSYGNDELKITPVISLRLNDYLHLIVNAGYSFRGEQNGDFYKGFKINLLKKDSYRACFGLNPCYEGAFLEKDRIKNDYYFAASGIMFSRLLPWILFSEIYYSSSVYGPDKRAGALMVEGDGITPLFLSAGVKYLFSGSFFIQISGFVDLLMNKGYILNSAEISMNIFF